MSVFWRLFLGNAVVLVIAGVALMVTCRRSACSW